ncbi:hypothetical protein OROGR_024929 [Orobanche gracilis]
MQIPSGMSIIPQVFIDSFGWVGGGVVVAHYSDQRRKLPFVIIYEARRLSRGRRGRVGLAGLGDTCADTSGHSGNRPENWTLRRHNSGHRGESDGDSGKVKKVVLPSGEGVVEAEPNFDEMRKIPGRGIIITGPATMGSGFDFFSRFFCPKLGVDEDPVCGSAHCALAAYWSRKLVKCDLAAFQASRRSGVLNLHIDETSHRVLLRGKAVVVMEGSLLV